MSKYKRKHVYLKEERENMTCKKKVCKEAEAAEKGCKISTEL